MPNSVVSLNRKPGISLIQKSFSEKKKGTMLMLEGWRMSLGVEQARQWRDCIVHE